DGGAFSASVTRELVVDADGYYVFLVESSDKARLTVSGRRIAEVDGEGDDADATIVEPLQRGTYLLRLEGRHPDKDTQVDLQVFRDGDDADWWRHPVLRLSDELR
ncbi:MAG TPA: hypothetical protein VFV97_17280, partial [Rhodanobacteraceae bacterium]|nr:hypothetical protein [Rhodanobacteraceae bacterium]